MHCIPILLHTVFVLPNETSNLLTIQYGNVQRYFNKTEIDSPGDQ